MAKDVFHDAVRHALEKDRWIITDDPLFLRFAEVIFDEVRDRYQVVHVGWSNKRRVYGCILHLDIKNGKIWIQHDGTEAGITNELMQRGVPREDIVLAFHSPFKRQFTEFAVG